MADSSLKHAASLVPVGQFAGKPAMPLTRGVLVVGSGKHCRFLLKSDSVSTTHTLLLHTSAGWYFRDLVSRTHTILNGKPQREASLKNGDTLTIGTFVFHFVSVGTPEPVKPVPPAAMEITDAEIPVPIDTRTVLIGRRVGCEVRLIEESVSLVHAAIFEADGLHFIRDLYSRTGTFLNGKKIHQEPLKFGDVIVIGETTIVYVPDKSAVSSSVAGMPIVGVEEDEPVVAVAPSVVPSVAAAPQESIPLAIDAELEVEPDSHEDDLLTLAPAAVVPPESLAVEPLPVEPSVEAPVEVPAATKPDVVPQPDVVTASADVAEPLSTIDLDTLEPTDDAPSEPPALASSVAGDLGSLPVVETPVAPQADARPKPLEIRSILSPELSSLLEMPVRTPQTLRGGIDLPVARRDDFKPAAVPVEPPAAEADVADEDITEVPTPAADAPKAEQPVIDEPPVVAEAPAADEPVIAEEPPVVPVGSRDLFDALLDEEAGPAVEASPQELLGVAPVDEAAPTVEDEAPAVADEAARVESRVDESALVEEKAPVGDDVSAEAVDVVADDVEDAEDAPAVANQALSVPTHDEPPSEPVVVAQPPLIASDIAPPAPLVESPLHDVPDELPADMTELAQLQMRIREALSDPSTLLSQPVLSEEPMPPQAMSEAARRARTIASLLESHEEIEEEAEREAAAISFDEPVAEQPAAEAPTPSEVATELADEPLADTPLAVEPEVAHESATSVEAEVVDEVPASVESVEPSIAQDPLEPATLPQDVLAEEIEADAIVETPSAEVIAVPEPVADVGAESPVVETPVVEVPDVEARADEVPAVVEETSPVSPEPVADAPATPVAADALADEVAADALPPLPAIEPPPVLSFDEAPAPVAPRIPEGPIDFVEPDAPPSIDLAEPEPIALATPEALRSTESLGGELTEAADVAEALPPETIDLGVEDRLIERVVGTPAEPPAAATDLALAAGESAVADDTAEPALEVAAIAPAASAQPTQDVFADESAARVEEAIVDSVAPVQQADADDDLRVESVEPLAATTQDAATVDVLDVVEPVAEIEPVVEVEPVADVAPLAAETEDALATPIAEVSVEDVAPQALADAPVDVPSPEVVADVVAPKKGRRPRKATAKTRKPPATSAEPLVESVPDSSTASSVDATAEAPAPVRIEIDQSASVPLEPLVEAFAEAPQTLDEIAEAAPAPVDNLSAEAPVELTDLTVTPDEMPVVVPEERAPVELDAANAGEVLTTAPTTLDEIEVQLVTPQLEQDAGAIADRDAIDGFDELKEPAAPVARAAEPIVVDDTDDDVPLEMQTRPLIAADEHLEDSGILDAVGNDAVTLVPGPASDAVASSLDVSPESVEADEPRDLEDRAVAFVPAAVEPVQSMQVEPVVDVEADTAGQGSLLDDAPAVAADASPIESGLLSSDLLADVAELDVGAPATLKLTPIDADGQPSTISLEAHDPSVLADVQAEQLIDQPAALDGATLASVESLSLEMSSDDVAVADAFSATEEPAAKDDDIEPPHRSPVPPEAVAVRSEKPTSVVNVDVPSMDELEATFRDAFAEALAMADGVSFAKPKAEAPKVQSIRTQDVEPKAPAPAPMPRPAPANTTKWELDESLLEQAERTPIDPLAGSSLAGPAALSLGGIGFIGDDTTDQFEQVPTSQRATPFPRGPVPLRGGMGLPRQSRKRRPVATDATPSTDAPLSSEAPVLPGDTQKPSVEARADELSDADLAGLSELQAEPSAELSADLPTIDATVTPVDESRPERSSDAPAVVAETPERLPAAEAPAVTLPPRPRRAPRPGKASVDDSLESAAPVSPFAAQELPLVDAFSQGASAGLDEMLSRIDSAGTELRDHPPVVHDKPAAPRGMPSPFASQLPIQNAGSPATRRTRQQVNKLPILLSLMVGLMGLAALGAWYAPVPVTVQVIVPFENLEKQNDVDRKLIQDRIKSKLPQAQEPARRTLNDRYGGGFLEMSERASFATIVDGARFQNDNMLVLEYRSNVNQSRDDIVRLNALASQVVNDNKDLVDARNRIIDTINRLEIANNARRAEKTRLENEMQALTATVENAPDNLPKLERELANLESARQQAAQRLDQAEAALKRLESNPMSFVPASLLAPEAPVLDESAMFVDAGETLAVAPNADAVALAQLDKLVAERDAAKKRLDQLLAAQTPEARQARENFDSSLNAFADEVAAARDVLGDRPEVVQYIESAQRLQDQIRSMTDTLVRRQQQQLTRLAEFQQQLKELTESTRDARAAGDPELKKWTDDLSFQERRLNAAKEASATDQEVGDIEAQISLLKNMIAAKREMLADPKASTVTKQLEDMMNVTRSEMAADREANDKLLADVQDNFRRQQPVLEKLPGNQKQLSEALAARLAQIDLARQRYTNVLSVSAGAEEAEINELKARLAEIEPQIATAQQNAQADAVAQAAEMERRAEAAKLLDAARAEVAVARQARDQAVEQYESRLKFVEGVREKVETARRAAIRKDELVKQHEALLATINSTIGEIGRNKTALEFAVVPVVPQSGRFEAVALDGNRMDPRFVYGVPLVCLIGLGFAPFIYREHRSRAPVAVATESDPSIPSNARTA